MPTIDQIRRDYQSAGLNREDLPNDPLELFGLWMEQAIAAGLSDPTAMTVATVDELGQPSQRMVLLKQFDSEGFVFYTNYESRKSKELANNPKISLHFPWHSVDRQVTIRGKASKVSTAQSLKYFLSRPRDSQIAASVSAQSSRINSRQFLMKQFDSMKHKLENKEVPLPDFWGGFRVVPKEIEFWQGRVNRLHDRFQFVRGIDQWDISRLSP
ncbi:pyridoxamine 5'-phosphate oxidase [Aurantivibrio plasticivorans]